MSKPSFNDVYTLTAKGDSKDVIEAVRNNCDLLSIATPGHNRTLLWIATRRNRVQIVKFLLKQGADPNIPGRIRSESFVLIKPYCVAISHNRKQIAPLFENYGNVLDGYSMAYLGMLEPLSTLIHQAPQNINLEQKEDKIWHVTPIHFAVSGGHKNIIQLLIDEGAYVRPYSSLLLDIAARRNRLDLVRLLLDAGAEAV